MPNPKYMSLQKDINTSMREILIDWLIQVHIKYRLRPETLFLTVNLIDRYLGMAIITRKNLQLVGVACMLIAAKYEEIYPPTAEDFVYITDYAYNKQEVLAMEGDILVKLDFEIHFTSPFRFLERYMFLKETSTNEKNFALFLLEGCLISYPMLKYKSSVLAGGCLYLANKLCFSKEPWSQKMEEYTYLDEQTLRQCARDIHQYALLKTIDEKAKLKAVFDKFASSKYGQVSEKI